MSEHAKCETQGAESVLLPVRPAGGWWARGRGLLGRPPPPPGTGLWLAPCRWVHTCGMAYAIDVVYLNRAGEILAVRTLRPWRIGPLVVAARGVLELAAGQAQVLGLRPGIRVNLIADRPHASKIAGVTDHRPRVQMPGDNAQRHEP